MHWTDYKMPRYGAGSVCNNGVSAYTIKEAQSLSANIQDKTEADFEAAYFGLDRNFNDQQRNRLWKSAA